MAHQTRRTGTLVVVCAFVLGGIAAAQEPVARPVDVVITGTVRDYDGRAVQGAFVILESSPRLCTTTDGLG